MAEFKLKLTKGTDEYFNRETLFLQELARVKLHNSMNKSWKEGVNKFSAMTVAEKNSLQGFSKAVKKAHEPKNQKDFDLQVRDVHNLPESVDWRSKPVISPVKDQGACGSCWAFASTAVMESHIALSTDLLFDLSPQQVGMPIR